MELASSTNIARAFMCSADDVTNTSAAFEGQLQMSVESIEGRRQRLYSKLNATQIGVGIELRKIGVAPKHSLAILKHKGISIATKDIEWLVVNSVGMADTAISPSDLCALLEAFVRDGASAFAVLHIPSIKERVGRAIRMTQVDIGVAPKTTASWEKPKIMVEFQEAEAKKRKAKKKAPVK